MEHIIRLKSSSGKEYEARFPMDPSEPKRTFTLTSVKTKKEIFSMDLNHAAEIQEIMLQVYSQLQPFLVSGAK